VILDTQPIGTKHTVIQVIYYHRMELSKEVLLLMARDHTISSDSTSFTPIFLYKIIPRVRGVMREKQIQMSTMKLDISRNYGTAQV